MNGENQHNHTKAGLFTAKQHMPEERDSLLTETLIMKILAAAQNQLPPKLGAQVLHRIFDIVAALSLLIVLGIPMMICAFVVYIRLGQPIIFKQERPGLHGQLFNVYKFRTMSEKKDDMGQLLPDSGRLSRTGDFLRKWGFDELPQLFNVLKGDMRIVGPRPVLLQHFLLSNSSGQFKRYAVKPGITGWAQINGRNTIEWQRKFEYDLWYVANHSLWIDLKIMFLTIQRVAKSAATNTRR